MGERERRKEAGGSFIFRQHPNNLVGGLWAPGPPSTLPPSPRLFYLLPAITPKPPSFIFFCCHCMIIIIINLPGPYTFFFFSRTVWDKGIRKEAGGGRVSVLGLLVALRGGRSGPTGRVLPCGFSCLSHVPGGASGGQRWLLLNVGERSYRADAVRRRPPGGQFWGGRVVVGFSLSHSPRYRLLSLSDWLTVRGTRVLSGPPKGHAMPWPRHAMLLSLSLFPSPSCTPLPG